MDFLTLLLLIVGGLGFMGIVAFIFREYLIHQENVVADSAKAQKKGVGGFDMVDLALWQLNSMYDELKKNGIPEEKLKPVKDRIGQLEFVKKNQGAIELALPYVNKFGKNVIKMLGG